jgi:hypothetical protein
VRSEVEIESMKVRLVGLIRRVALAGLACAISGVVVLGVGGRIVMFVSRLLHPEAVGRFTESGNRIGEFTVSGTIDLILFGGLGFGLTAGVVWVLVRQWLPKNAALVGLVTVGMGGSFLVEADNRDFVILGDPLIDLVLLVSLVFSFGLSLYWLDRWLIHRMDSPVGTLGVAVYSVMALMGVLFAYATFATFFSADFCFCSNPPRWTGVFLAAASFATIGWWVQHLRGAETPSSAMRVVGTTSVALAALAGAIHLSIEIIHIL